jgi:hypothetical protein
LRARAAKTRAEGSVTTVDALVELALFVVPGLVLWLIDASQTRGKP